jgi:non-ribosomal peptide synthetase component F
VGNAVHRIIEQRASTAPDAVAIADGSRVITYRELNQRANALARHLCASGLTRGALAFVRMPRSTDLAVILLAIFKAGACYAWIDPGSRDDGELPASFCILRDASAGEERYLAIDIDCALRDTSSRSGPNLPVLTRGADVACVLPDRAGRPNVLVPHATIAALPRARALLQTWEGSAGALDLWVGLMSGTTLSLGVTSPATAAA